MLKTILDKYLVIIKKTLPEKICQPSVGLDIGSDSCKAVQMVLRGNSYEILNYAIEPVVTGDTLTATKKILDKFYLQTKSITSSVSGKGTLIRYIEMPKMPIEDLRNSIGIEADKHFPFAKDQIYTDCFIIDSPSKSNVMSVLLAAAKKEIIEKRMKLLAQLDMRTDFIGIDSMAIANVFNVINQRMEQPEAQMEKAKGNVIAILDIGHTISSLIILKNSVPYFTRDIFMGGHDLNKRISNTLAVDMGKASALKCDPKDNLNEVRAACDSVLMNLSSELRLSFDYFVTEKNIPITKLYLTGGTSNFTGMSDFFAKNFDIPVEHWNPLDFFNLAPHLDKEELNAKMSQLGVALGLALYRA